MPFDLTAAAAAGALAAASAVPIASISSTTLDALVGIWVPIPGVWSSLKSCSWFK